MHGKLFDILAPQGKLLTPITQVENLSEISKQILIMQAVRLNSKQFRNFLDILYASRHKVLSKNFFGMFFRLKFINDICSNSSIIFQDANKPVCSLEHYFKISENHIEITERIRRIIIAMLPELNEKEYSSQELENLLTNEPDTSWRYNSRSGLLQIEKDEWVIGNSIANEAPSQQAKDIINQIRCLLSEEISPVTIILMIELSISQSPFNLRRYIDKLWRLSGINSHKLVITCLQINSIISDPSLPFFEQVRIISSLRDFISDITAEYDDILLEEAKSMYNLKLVAAIPRPLWRTQLSPKHIDEVPESANTGKYNSADEFKMENIKFDLKHAQQDESFRQVLMIVMDNLTSENNQHPLKVILKAISKAMEVGPANVAFYAAISGLSQLYIQHSIATSIDYSLVRAANSIREAVDFYFDNHQDKLEMTFTTNS